MPIRDTLLKQARFARITSYQMRPMLSLVPASNAKPLARGSTNLKRPPLTGCDCRVIPYQEAGVVSEGAALQAPLPSGVSR
jgi:hypothetical protein